jgi:hypothetical protein
MLSGLRSRLALAGATDRKGGDDDGVLTALEAAGLDLWGTKRPDHPLADRF